MAGAPAASQLEAQIGYGVSLIAQGRDAVLTPYAGLTLGAADSRGYRIGGRLNLGPSFGLSLEGERRESAVAPATHGLTLRGSPLVDQDLPPRRPAARGQHHRGGALVCCYPGHVVS